MSPYVNKNNIIMTEKRLQITAEDTNVGYVYLVLVGSLPPWAQRVVAPGALLLHSGYLSLLDLIMA